LGSKKLRAGPQAPAAKMKMVASGAATLRFARGRLRSAAGMASGARCPGSFPPAATLAQRTWVKTCSGTTDAGPTKPQTPEEKKLVYRPMTETVRTFLNPAHFFMLLKAHGTGFFTGVPDSLLANVCAYITDNTSSGDHIIAANEGTAMAAAAGHYLATGQIACVYLQNSGLGNLVNPLLSLCSSKVYAIPTLMLIGWRGEPGKKDEPQHLLQGKLTPTMLTEMGIPYEILPDYAEGAFEVLEKAYAYMKENHAPFALLVKKQTFEKYSLDSEVEAFTCSNMLHREEILEQIIHAFPNDPLVTTTGFTSREMFELRIAKGQGHDKDFLTVGSMGHCSSIALGIAMAKPQTQVIAVDGDGAAIMHMGAFATAGKSNLKNYKHILINNAVHDSVGGQPTGAGNVNFSAIALACGYKNATCVAAANDISVALQRLNEQDGPAFLEIQALTGARADLGRPTTTTYQNKDAFMKMLMLAK